MHYKMNRSIHLIALVLMISLNALAQVPANKAKTDVTVFTAKTNPVDSVDTLIENKLVELATKSPAYSAAGHQNRINELELRKTKNAWLNLLSLSTNYNDQSFAKTTPNATYIYPKYFFGVTIPLGIIFSQGTQVKSARESLALSKDHQEELIRGIKSDILGKYKQYKLYNALIEMQSELINDVVAHASQAEEDFKKGNIAVDTYIIALKTRNDELAKKMNLKLQQDLIQLEIEKIIGVPLQEVLHPTPPVK